MFFSLRITSFSPQRGLLLSYQISPVRQIWAHMEGVIIPKVVPSWELTYPTRGIGKLSSKVPLKRDMLVSRRVKCQNMSQKASFVGLCCTIATPVCFKGDGEISSCRHVASGNLSISDDEYPYLGHLDVSENSGTPKSSILIGFSIINHPFWGTPIFGNTHLGRSICFR